MWRKSSSPYPTLEVPCTLPRIHDKSKPVFGFPVARVPSRGIAALQLLVKKYGTQHLERSVLIFEANLIVRKVGKVPKVFSQCDHLVTTRKLASLFIQPLSHKLPAPMLS